MSSLVIFAIYYSGRFNYFNLFQRSDIVILQLRSEHMLFVKFIISLHKQFTTLYGVKHENQSF